MGFGGERGKQLETESLPLPAQRLSGLSNSPALEDLAENSCICVHTGNFSHVCEPRLKHTCLWHKAGLTILPKGRCISICFHAGLKIESVVLEELAVI